MNVSLEGVSEEQLFGALPRSVTSAVSQFETAGADFDAVGALLANTPALGVSMKGVTWKATLWQSVKSEFHSFLCTGSESYADLRNEWDGLRQKGSTFLVASLSGAIGAQLGVASGVLAPLVVWLLVAMLRIGKEALCATLAVALPAGAGPGA